MLIIRIRTILAGAVVVALLVHLTGCTTSAPRFVTPPSSADRAAPEDSEIRFAAKIREEEAREDDRKVDIGSLAQRLAKRPKSAARYSNTTPQGLSRDKILLEIVGLIGVPYAFGGSSKSGIDCSGFTSYIYQAAGARELPRSTRQQFSVGTKIPEAQLQFGDLVFFNTTGYSPSHVGIYIEDDLFAHASVTYGVTISSLESTYYRNRYVGARRVVQ